MTISLWRALEFFVSGQSRRSRHPCDQADLGQVRGRIDVRRPATRSLLSKGQVACRFDSHSADTPRSRLARQSQVIDSFNRNDKHYSC